MNSWGVLFAREKAVAISVELVNGDKAMNARRRDKRKTDNSRKVLPRWGNRLTCAGRAVCFALPSYVSLFEKGPVSASLIACPSLGSALGVLLESVNLSSGTDGHCGERKLFSSRRYSGQLAGGDEELSRRCC
jgi:hypothetical protein